VLFLLKPISPLSTSGTSNHGIFMQRKYQSYTSTLRWADLINPDSRSSICHNTADGRVYAEYQLHRTQEAESWVGLNRVGIQRLPANRQHVSFKIAAAGTDSRGCGSQYRNSRQPSIDPERR
jgi:hypothetical protein